MPISLNTLYNFVFGDWEKPRVIPEGVILSADQKAKKIAREEQEKQETIEQFSVIVSNKIVSAEFRMLLRDLNNSDLECLLYGNNRDELTRTPRHVSCYRIPTDDVIKKMFAELDQKYNYCARDKNAATIFVKLFKASKLIADFIETNNSADNVEAFIHAYKMMSLFNVNLKQPFESVDNFIKRHAMDLTEPVLDVLELTIPPNIPHLRHLQEWRALISQKGKSILSMFQQAHEIEKIIDEKQQSFTLESILTAVTQVRYKNASQHPELAKLCVQYQVSERIFNRCLETKSKQSDRLPDVIVDGNTVGQQGYYLVKLPLDDPRAYILGHITHCCQSIGGESERCVIDGISRESNGFYVLLRAKLETDQRPLCNGKINYDHYTIVGQSYAWLSRLNNLTFDSWENLTPNVDDSVIAVMLPEFAKKCFVQKPDIGRITIGTGGKTPEFYSKSIAIADDSEKMAEGRQYGDSPQQVVIAVNPAIEERSVLIKAKLAQSGIYHIPDMYSMKQVEWFTTLLNETIVETYQHLLGVYNYTELLILSALEPNVQAIVIQLHRANALTIGMVDYILSDKYHKEIFRQTNVQKMAKLLGDLYKIAPSLITEENFKLLAANIDMAQNIFIGLSTLYKANPDLMTDENLKLLAQCANHVDEFINEVEELSHNASTPIGNLTFRTKTYRIFN